MTEDHGRSTSDRPEGVASETAAEDDAARAERDRRSRVLTIALILFLGLPIYLIVAAYAVAALSTALFEAERPGYWVVVEFVIYLGLGMVWAFPLKSLVQGVGKRRA